MITTVCMNPAFDKTAAVDRHLPGQVNRLENIRCEVGGKGINVALVLRQLGAKAACVGVLGADNKALFLESLANESLPFHALTVPGQVRTNWKIVDRSSGVTTEYNEPGPFMRPAFQEPFAALLRRRAKSGYVVLSGSLPRGCPKDAYREYMRRLPGRMCVLDAEGEALRLGVKGLPFLVKPNLPELEALAKKELREPEAVRDAALALQRQGARNVIVSMGSRGALMTDGHAAVFSPALDVRVNATVGAGDALLAGVLLGLERGDCLRDAFCLGMAAGAASVMAGGPRQVRPKDVQSLLERVTLREV